MHLDPSSCHCHALQNPILSVNTRCRRALCEKIGVDMEGKGTAVVDHVDHVLGGTGHTSILADGFSSSNAILGGFTSRVSCPPS